MSVEMRIVRAKPEMLCVDTVSIEEYVHPLRTHIPDDVDDYI